VVAGDYSAKAEFNGAAHLVGKGVSAIFCFRDIMARPHPVRWAQG
jgi:DNA-binding LacI/PurR family transcriptional regulator